MFIIEMILNLFGFSLSSPAQAKPQPSANPLLWEILWDGQVYDCKDAYHTQLGQPFFEQTIEIGSVTLNVQALRVSLPQGNDALPVWIWIHNDRNRHFKVLQLNQNGTWSPIFLSWLPNPPQSMSTDVRTAILEFADIALLNHLLET